MTVGQVTKERVTTRSFRQTLAYIPAREQADETRAKVLRKMKPRRVGSNLGKLSTRQREAPALQNCPDLVGAWRGGLPCGGE